MPEANQENNSAKKTKLSTEPYKGVRDFYPEDMFIQNYIFGVMRTTVEKFGYSEYTASILEPTELYRSKTSDEIVNDQTYSFKDRGDRDVTLRPEMTPTVARMVAAHQRELGFPLRWYSIPNVFRYENPQRGRLREHWQLNVDLFGSKNLEADIEMIGIAHTLMKSFSEKISDSEFEIRISSRKWLNALFESFGLSEPEMKSATQLIDRKNKMSGDEFASQAGEIFKDKLESFTQALKSENKSDLESFEEIQTLISTLESQNIKVMFDPTIVRGFNYYTGIVFEVFDTNSENKRSLFGGGRYDNLTVNFGGDPVPAVGFGMGDVTIRDFLETRKLLPDYKSATGLYIAVLDNRHEYAASIAHKLRNAGVNVFINFEGKDIHDHFKLIEKRKIPFALFVGSKEADHHAFKIRNISTKNDSVEFSDEDISEIVKLIKK